MPQLLCTELPTPVNYTETTSITFLHHALSVAVHLARQGHQQIEQPAEQLHSETMDYSEEEGVSEHNTSTWVQLTHQAREIGQLQAVQAERQCGTSCASPDIRGKHVEYSPCLLSLWDKKCITACTCTYMYYGSRVPGFDNTD